MIRTMAVAIVASIFFASAAGAGGISQSVDEAQQDSAFKATSACPILPPLPVAPPPDVPSTTFSVVTGVGISTHGLKVTWWRQQCAPDGSTNMFLRLEGISYFPDICPGDFTLVQGGSNFVVDLVQQYDGASYIAPYCTRLYIPITLLVTICCTGQPPPFDPWIESELYVSNSVGTGHATLAAFNVDTVPTTPAVGLWWNPAESGSGYNIDVKHGVLVLTVYSYKPNGDSEWYIATGTLTNGGRSFVGSLDKARNGQCISCPYKEPVLGGSDGPVTIEFSSATKGTMTLPGGRVVPIEPQAF